MRFSLTLLVVLALSIPAEAQQAKKIPRIGYVVSQSALSPRDEDFRQGLQGLGYADGKNILVEYRYADGKLDRMPGIVAELVQLKVDVLVTGDLTAILPAKEATKTIPIVIITSVDPVAAGIVDSLARPGGNITGLTRLGRDLGGKRLELLKEVVPGLSRVGVLWADSPGAAIGLKEYQATGRALKMELLSLEVRVLNPDFEPAFQAAVDGRVRALIIISNPVLRGYMKQIAELAAKNRVLSMCEDSQYVETGCLLSYAANYQALYRRAATYVDKILKGAKPADLPVEQPTKFELIINLKAAKQIALTIPQSVLYQADKVIK